MKIDTNIFKIKKNDVLPTRGKILISEPFLNDTTFGRAVVLLVDHTSQGSMGIILNKQTPFLLNNLLKDFKNSSANIFLNKGGPLAHDTLFYLHRIKEVPNSLKVKEGLYLNGDYDVMKEHVLAADKPNEMISFFLGYCAWEEGQLEHEIEENTWIVTEQNLDFILNKNQINIWRKALENMGSKYATWAKFPQIPSLN